MKKRKIPIRRCVISGEQLPKQELVRVVRQTDGTVTVDTTGKVNGRGAYLKLDTAIILKAQKTKKLDRQLEVEVPEQIYSDLMNLIQK